MVGVWLCPENGIKYLQMDCTSRPEKSFVRQINIMMKRRIVKLGVQGTALLSYQKAEGLRKEYVLEELGNPLGEDKKSK